MSKNISETIEILESIRAEHGDLKLWMASADPEGFLDEPWFEVVERANGEKMLEVRPE